MNEQQPKVVEKRNRDRKPDPSPVATIITAFAAFVISAAESIADPTTISLIMAGIKLSMQVISYVFAIDVVMKQEDVKEDMAGTSMAAMIVSASYEIAQIGAPFTHPALVLIFQSFATELSKAMNRVSFRKRKYKKMRKK